MLFALALVACAQTTPTPVPTATLAQTPALSQTPCPSELNPDWWIPESFRPGTPGLLTYCTPSLEHLIYYSDIVVHASLTSVVTRTERFPLPDYIVEYAEIPPGKVPAQGCRAVMELRFAVTEYLKGTGSEDILVHIPLNITYLIDGLLHFYYLEEEAQARVAESWSKRSPLWDDRKAVLFLKFDENDDQMLSLPIGTGVMGAIQTIHTSTRELGFLR